MILPPNLRDELKIPLGKLILNDSSEKESYIQKIYSEKVVITVGDATSELLLGMGLTPLLQMKQQNPGKKFIPASEKAECEYMKMITLEKVYNSLLNEENVVTVPKDKTY